MGESSRPSGQDYKFQRLEEENLQRLLPGLPNDLTLQLIGTKLGGTDFVALSAVSQPWRYLVRSRLLYDTRLESRSRDTVIVHRHCSFLPDQDTTVQDSTDKLALFSPKLWRCYEVPGIRQLNGRLPVDSQWIALDGKLYLLGGKDPSSGNGSNRVYSLDIAAGEQVWDECASMHTGRYSFACAVFNHKIFAFEGYKTFEQELVCGSEVFDARLNEWSIIESPESAWIAGHRVLSFNHLFFLEGGEHRDETLQVYNVATTTWRVVERIMEFVDGEFLSFPGIFRGEFTLQFLYRGEFYLLRADGIYVEDDLGYSEWTEIHTNVFPYCFHDEILPESVTVFNDNEIILVASWPNDGMISYLYYAKGFGDDNVQELVWKGIESCSDPVASLTCPISL